MCEKRSRTPDFSNPSDIDGERRVCLEDLEKELSQESAKQI
jgi:hypothetical protein